LYAFGDATTTIVVLRLIFASTHAPIPRKAPKRAGVLRLPLRKHLALRPHLRARPHAAPTSAEEREAWVGTVVREDARAELRVVRRADDVRRRPAYEIRLLLVWLMRKRKNV
jgi:hypothetical protein